VGKDRINILVALVIVFVASASTMVIELIAGRMLAPYMGVNLYTWTSIIGVVLAGISLGNFTGGWLADRWASRLLLTLIFVAAALSTLSILPLLSLVTAVGSGWQWPLMLKIVVYVAAIFFLPGFIMGTVSPVVIKLCLSDLARAGKTVGLIYAFSTVGSIVGTFLTGFFLVSTFGTRSVVFGVAAVLAAMALVAGGLRLPPRPVTVATQLVGLLLVGGAAGVLIRRDAHVSPFLRETNYFTININRRTLDDGTVSLALVLDHLIHSFSTPDDPLRLEYGYERIYRELTDLKAESHPQPRTAFIGGGGYTYPRYIETAYPGSTVHVVEIDPAVTQVAYEFLGVPADSRIVPFNEDARLFFNERRWDAPYDIIYGDAFNDLSVPYHLTTSEFAGLVHEALAPDGVYMVNIIDSYQRGEFLRAFLNTLDQHFEHVYLFALGEAWRSPNPSTYVVVGAKQALDIDRLTYLATRNGRAMEGRLLPPEEMAAYMASGRQIILTDDFVPVDQMLAPLFNERGF
jgi:spermidine synthase